jgi:hypothetical protein
LEVSFGVWFNAELQHAISVNTSKCVSSGFRREADENLRVLWPLKKGPTGCLETSVRNYHYTARNNPEERSSQGPECFTNEIFCNMSVSLTCLDAAQQPKSVHSVSVFLKFGECSDRTYHARVHSRYRAAAAAS